MTLMTQSQLIAHSTGVFYDNTVGAIQPSGFRQMHEHIADSIMPHDSSGVPQISVVPTGSVPTPTPTGAMIFDANNGYINIFDGTNWLTFQPI